MINACEEHQNSVNDFIVVHEYSKCPVCKMEELIEDQETQINDLETQIEDIEYENRKETDRLENKQIEEIDNMQDEIDLLKEELKLLNEGKNEL